MLINTVRQTARGTQSAEIHSDAGRISLVTTPRGTRQIVIDNGPGLPEGEVRFATIDLDSSDVARLRELLG